MYYKVIPGKVGENLEIHLKNNNTKVTKLQRKNTNL